MIDASGRRRLKDLWWMLNSQMGALMRAEIERQGIDLPEAVERHRVLVDAVSEATCPVPPGDCADHYLTGFPGTTRLARPPGGRTVGDCGCAMISGRAGDRRPNGRRQLRSAAARAPGSTGIAIGQRGWKWQPGGRSMAFGMSPVSAGLIALRLVVSRGAALTSAWV